MQRRSVLIQLMRLCLPEGTIYENSPVLPEEHEAVENQMRG
jgi:hypothetical protein